MNKSFEAPTSADLVRSPTIHASLECELDRSGLDDKDDIADIARNAASLEDDLHARDDMHDLLPQRRAAEKVSATTITMKVVRSAFAL